MKVLPIPSPADSAQICPPCASTSARAIVQSSVFLMHKGMDGPHDFAVHLKANDPNNPDLVVSVLSNWMP